jgi:hypothetical protein
MTTWYRARSRRRRILLLLTAISVLTAESAVLLLAPTLAPLALDVTVLIALRIAIVRTRPPGQIRDQSQAAWTLTELPSRPAETRRIGNAQACLARSRYASPTQRVASEPQPDVQPNLREEPRTAGPSDREHDRLHDR